MPQPVRWPSPARVRPHSRRGAPAPAVARALRPRPLPSSPSPRWQARWVCSSRPRAAACPAASAPSPSGFPAASLRRCSTPRSSPRTRFWLPEQPRLPVRPAPSARAVLTSLTLFAAPSRPYLLWRTLMSKDLSRHTPLAGDTPANKPGNNPKKFAERQAAKQRAAAVAARRRRNRLLGLGSIVMAVVVVVVLVAVWAGGHGGSTGASETSPAAGTPIAAAVTSKSDIGPARAPWRTRRVAGSWRLPKRSATAS